MNNLQLNREYAVRHLGVALLFLGLGGWFAFDGQFGWPGENARWEQERGTTVAAYLAAHPGARRTHAREERDGLPHLPTELVRQMQFAVLCGGAALVIAFLLFLDWRRTLAWDDEKMCGSLTGGKPLAFADVALDDAQWEKKGILRVIARDGRRFTLDTWHHAGARTLAEKLLAQRKGQNAAPDGTASASA